MTETQEDFAHVTVDLTARPDDLFDGWQSTVEDIDIPASHSLYHSILAETIQKHYPDINVEQSCNGSVKGNQVYGAKDGQEEQGILYLIESLVIDTFENYDEWLVLKTDRTPPQTQSLNMSA